MSPATMDRLVAVSIVRLPLVWGAPAHGVNHRRTVRQGAAHWKPDSVRSASVSPAAMPNTSTLMS